MSSTLARLPGLRAVEPLKITSCIDSPRSSEARDSPSTQRTASMMLDLPQPFGPTTPTSWPGTWKWVGSTKDLKPASFIEVRRTAISLIEKNSGNGPAGLGAKMLVRQEIKQTPVENARAVGRFRRSDATASNPWCYCLRPSIYK